MVASEFPAKGEQLAIVAQQMNLEGLGATANEAAFLHDPDAGVHYNVFADVWRRACSYFKRNHGDTHR